ncbi:flagellin, partial [Pseudoalteromonas sp. S558]
LGASMNRLDHTMNNVTNMKENTQAAASTLMDADFAAETSNMTKQQLLMNSGISVLSTANSTTQMIGSLLR